MNNSKRNESIYDDEKVSTRGLVTNIEDLQESDKKALGLLVEIENYQGSFLGVINNLDKKRRILFLEKITILSSKKRRTVNYMGFYFDSIEKIYIVNKDDEVRRRLLEDCKLKPSTVPLLPQHLVPPRLNGQISNPDNDDIASVSSCLDLETFEPISHKDGNIPDHIYIDELGEEFIKALSIITKKSEFGLSAVGHKMGRAGTLSLIAIHSSILHIFDVAKIKAENLFNTDLKNIFECPSTLKIMHDGRALQDYLYHQHNIKLIRIFDLTACDLYIRRQEDSPLSSLISDLTMIIFTYLDLSKESIWALEEDISDSLWFQRPLVNTALAKLSQSALFLQEAGNAMERFIMKDAYELMDKFVNSIIDLDDSAVKNRNPLVVPFDIRTDDKHSYDKKKDSRFNKIITYS